MVAQWLTVVGGVCMALFPPLAYSDQYISICRKRNSAGFSTDIPGLLIVANITRCIYWLGARFQIYLLVQSILMIGAQFGILYVCLLYKDRTQATTRKGTGKRRPLNLWQWERFPPYLEFSALLVLLHCIMFVFLHRFKFYIDSLGFIALGLEATLPIPQLLVNFENKSTAGFRSTVLAGWFLGDLFKTVYYFATGDNGIAFKSCAVFQLSVDCMLLVQTFWYRKQTRTDLELRAKRFSPEGGGEVGGHHHHRDDDENRLEEDPETVQPGGGGGGGGGVKVGTGGSQGSPPPPPSRKGSLKGGVIIDDDQAEEAGVAGPESLLNPKTSRNGSVRTVRSTKSARGVGVGGDGRRQPRGGETVFELESSSNEEDSDDEEGNEEWNNSDKHERASLKR